jgi:hypothetical protein
MLLRRIVGVNRNAVPGSEFLGSDLGVQLQEFSYQRWAPKPKFIIPNVETLKPGKLKLGTLNSEPRTALRAALLERLARV